MARNGIRKEQVWKTAQALQDEGRTPTIQAIRQRLGSGSYSTISRHLASWREHNRPQPSLPPVPESVQEIANRLWAEAQRLSREELEQARSQWEAEKKALHQELSDLAFDLDQKDKAITEAMSKLEDSICRLTESEIALEFQKAECERLKREKAEALERQRLLERENAAVTQKLEDMAGEIARLQTELAALRQQERQVLDEIARLKLQLDKKAKRGRSPGRKKHGNDSA